MRSTTYSALERGVASTAGIDPTNVLAHEKVMIAEYINDAIRFCWDYYPWAEFTVTEERYFRDEFDVNVTYAEGAEVYYEGKYWKLWNAMFQGMGLGTPPKSGIEWHEVGDYISTVEWSEKGTYKLGAVVKYETKTYLCIEQLAGTTPSGVDLVNYEWDGITPLFTTYFKELDTTFERYIPYEQTGKNTIGTILSVHTGDPRYNNVQPLNWREGAEGIYISTLNEDQNSLWIRYRKEAPTFTSDSTTEEVPNFLVPAIKAYAYRGWLIGAGQHEKSQLQDIHGLDLLVREVDKLNNQQDRAMPYAIPSEPYRRINARGSSITDITEEQIGGVKEGLSDLTFKLTSSDISGRNVVKKGNSEIGFKVNTSNLIAENKVVQETVKIVNFILYSTIIGGGRVTKDATVVINFKFTTGKAHQSINTGEIRAYAMAQPAISISFNINVSSIVERSANASLNFGLNVQPIANGTNSNISASANLNFGLNISFISNGYSSALNWNNANQLWNDSFKEIGGSSSSAFTSKVFDADTFSIQYGDPNMYSQNWYGEYMSSDGDMIYVTQTEFNYQPSGSNQMVLINTHTAPYNDGLFSGNGFTLDNSIQDGNSYFTQLTISYTG